MRTAWMMEGDSFDDWPAGRRVVATRVEPAPGGFWSYREGHRSAGRLQETPLHTTLTWLIEQIALGHSKTFRDERGDIVAVTIGRSAAYPAASEREAAECAYLDSLALQIAGAVAEAREQGFRPAQEDLHRKIWQDGSPRGFRRMEMHYALTLARLLGRISKNLPKLQELPILGDAPEMTRGHMGEATRCYLLKLDRACVALCRACLEDALRSKLTPSMEKDWRDAIAENKRRFKTPNPMHALIEVCARHGILGDLKRAAHDVREAGNKVLHLRRSAKEHQDLAGDVLRKTRSVIALIYGR